MTKNAFVVILWLILSIAALAVIATAAFFLIQSLASITVPLDEEPPRCTIETIRGTVEYGTSCVSFGGRLDCKEKTYGMYLSYACEVKKGEK